MTGPELTILPDGFVRCYAGCDEIGEHNDRPCLTCGGLGYHRDPKTSACPTVPPTGQADPNSGDRNGNPDAFRPPGPKPHPGGTVLVMAGRPAEGVQQEITQC